MTKYNNKLTFENLIIAINYPPCIHDCILFALVRRMLHWQEEPKGRRKAIPTTGLAFYYY